jgi:hypothetical protein
MTHEDDDDDDDDDDVKNNFCDKVEQVFNQFPRHYTNILLGDFNARVGMQDIFKLILGNENLHEVSNDNGVRVVNFAT